MNIVARISKWAFCLIALAISVGCGMAIYPGQPGMVTNGYAKVDLEYLQDPGLFVYEVVYDNRAGQPGVGAIITKLYPNVQTFTSNVRTNADGTLYRNKMQYEGAELQMISIPSLNQIHLSPNNKVTFFMEYDTSLDEVDDKNVAEQNIFKPMEGMLSAKAMEFKKFRWDLFRASTLLPTGNLAFEVTAVEFAPSKFTPSKPVTVETNFFQNAIRTDMTPEVRAEFVQFLETNFPKGFKGTVNAFVKGSTQPIPMKMGIQTIKTAEANGVQIKNDATEAMAQEILNRFKTKK